MTPQQKRKLERLAKALDEAQIIIGELLQQSTSEVEQEPASEFDSRTVMASLRVVERGAAAERLAGMKQHELGALFVEAGGPSSDKRKPKVWLVDQILWRLFDFERGHEAIRGRGTD